MTCQRLRDRDVFCEACRALVPESRPLSGWLWLVTLNLVAAPVSFVLAAGRLWTRLRDESLELIDGAVGGWLGWSVLEVSLAGVVAVLAVIVWPRYFGRRRAAVSLVKVFFFAAVVTSAITRWALGKAQVPVPLLLDWTFMTSVLWLVVFERSKAVSETFVR